MKKECGVLFLFLLVISFVSAAHFGDGIYLNVNGQNANLQGGITANHFRATYSGGSYSGNIIFGHNANEIIANVNGTVKNFAAALSDGTLNSTLPGRSPASYGSYNLIHGEYAINVLVSNTTTTINLQQAINDGWFYVVPCVVSTYNPLLNTFCGSKTVTTNCGTSEVKTGTLSCTSGCNATTNACNSCVPKTCASLGYTCGSWSDGCGGTISCGSCSYGSCQAGGYCQATWRGWGVPDAYCVDCDFGYNSWNCLCPSGWSVVSVTPCASGGMGVAWTMTCRK